MKKKVLIVDDEPNIVLSVEYLMRRAGFDVAVAEDGEAAMARIREQRPDLVVLDVIMPGIGVHAHRHLDRQGSGGRDAEGIGPGRRRLCGEALLHP